MGLNAKQTEDHMKTSDMIKHQYRASTRKIISFAAAAILLMLFFACENDTDPAADAEDIEAAQLDALEDFYSEDAEDLGIIALSENDVEGGRSASNDPRLSCASITRSGDEESGTIVIDFGEGCEDSRGNTRRGIIRITFEGHWMTPSSFWTLQFVEYTINKIRIEGTRTATNVSESEDGDLAFEVALEDGSLTWPDGSVARKKFHRRRELERDENNILKRLILYGSAEGNHRNGRGFQVTILERLIFDRECSADGVIIPVSGKKLIQHGEREITIDYGSGECDNTVTIINQSGRSWQYTVKG